MRMTFALRPSLPLTKGALSPPGPPLFSDSADAGLPTRYFTIFLSILIGLMLSLLNLPPRTCRSSLLSENRTGLRPCASHRHIQFPHCHELQPPGHLQA